MDLADDIENVVVLDDSQLAIQDIAKLNLNTISPLTPEVMSRQATINVGAIGHVAHGKTTLVVNISGSKSRQSAAEKTRNITVDIGYANAKLYKDPTMSGPSAYASRPSKTPDTIKNSETGNPMHLVRHISFVDCPGHNSLMATMLNGASIMDAAVLLIAADESFPQGQTVEHVKAVEIMKLSKLIVVLNKIDRVGPADLTDRYNAVSQYISRNLGLSAPILPVAAQFGSNVDLVIEHLAHIPVPIRNFTCPPRMVVIRSFDVNKPGDIDSLSGGVAGGTLTHGVMTRGMNVEVRPGRVTTIDGKTTCRPLRTSITALTSEHIPLEYAVPGGLIGVQMKLDPSLTIGNRLVGQIIGLTGSLPGIQTELTVEYELLSSIIVESTATQKATDSKVSGLALDEQLQLHIGSSEVSGSVLNIKKEGSRHGAIFKLDKPVCCSLQDRVAISRNYKNQWRLIGWGSVFDMVAADLQ